MKSSFKYASSVSCGFLFIYFIIGMLIPAQKTFSFVPSPWSIRPSQYDKLLIENHASYLVEGKAGLSMHLGDYEYDLRKKWGVPDYRDYNRPERLYYRHSVFQGSFVLKNGRIVMISYDAVKGRVESLKWQTALGLRRNDFNNLEEKQIREKIINFYETEFYYDLPDYLDIYSRGIRFNFRNGRIFRVDIYEPRYYRNF